MNLSYIFKIPTGLRVSVVLVALILGILTLGATTATAQSDGGNTLGAVLEALEGLEGSADLDGVRSGANALDRLRGNSAARAASFEDEQEANRIKLNINERRLISRFCSGNASEVERRAIEFVDRFSRVERDYCERAKQPVFQLGYSMFEGKFGNEILLNGAVQEDFLLGIGDSLVINLIGAQSQSLTVDVDREGRISIEGLPQLLAAGRTVGEVRAELAAMTARAFTGTESFISVGSVREIGIFVVGEVARPGLHRITALSTAIDALGVAGGVLKTGTLRGIRIVRRGETIPLDLYGVLFDEGGAANIKIQEGDRLVVPTIGPTVAVVGDVKKPGIIELPHGEAAIDLERALPFVGGRLRPRGNRFVALSFNENGSEQVVAMSNANRVLYDGDILNVLRSRDVQLDGVELLGHVRVPGRRSLVDTPTLADLVGDREAFGRTPYLLFGILETVDPSVLSRRVFGVNLRKIIDGEENYELRSGDRLFVLGQDDVAFLSSDQVQRVIDPAPEEFDNDETADGGNLVQAATSKSLEEIAAKVGFIQSQLNGIQNGGQDPSRTQTPTSGAANLQTGPCESVQRLIELSDDLRPDRFANAFTGSGRSDERLSSGHIGSGCPAIFDMVENLLPFVLEHSAIIGGEVRRPGVYPIAIGAGLNFLVGAAGGLSSEADLRHVELTRFRAPDPAADNIRSTADLSAGSLSQVVIGGGDVVRFGSTFSDRDLGSITLRGEFVRPGTYQIRRGERLTEVFARAGGLTRQAYPFGAIFTRARVRIAEGQALRRLSRELNSAVTVAAANRGIDAGAISAFSNLTRDLSEAPAIGRVVIEADPTVLQVRPELDMTLEPDDQLVMPKRPNSVLVTGDVLNPGALQFISGKGLDKYITQAGGFQRSADRSRLFVVFPNGAAQPVSTSPFNFTPIQVPPGSTIVVPKDATPFDLFRIAQEVSTVLSQLAITAASLAVISNN